MHLVDVATGMQLKSTGQGRTCVPFLIKGKTKMTVYGLFCLWPKLRSKRWPKRAKRLRISARRCGGAARRDFTAPQDRSTASRMVRRRDAP